MVDPDQLEDFVPIKRGYNKKSFYGSFYGCLAIGFIFFWITSSWPLEVSMPWWAAILYALGGAGSLWAVFTMGGGMLKGMFILPAYYLFIFLVCLLGLEVKVLYLTGILTFMLYVVVGGVTGWVLQQGS